jgi:hypothetical protein
MQLVKGLPYLGLRGMEGLLEAVVRGGDCSGSHRLSLKRAAKLWHTLSHRGCSNMVQPFVLGLGHTFAYYEGAVAPCDACRGARQGAMSRPAPAHLLCPAMAL